MFFWTWGMLLTGYWIYLLFVALVCFCRAGIGMVAWLIARLSGPSRAERALRAAAEVMGRHPEYVQRLEERE